MTVECFAIQQISTLVSEYDKLELELYIDDFSYSVDFSATIGEEKKQCLDLIDAGVISNKAYEKVARAIAEYIRTTDVYKPGCVNKFTSVIK